MSVCTLHQGLHCVLYSTGFFRYVQLCVSISTKSLHPLRMFWCFIFLMKRASPKPQKPLVIFIPSAILPLGNVRELESFIHCATFSEWLSSLGNMQLESYHVSMYNVITHLCYSSVLFHHRSTRMCLATCLLKDRCLGFLPSFAIMTEAAKTHLGIFVFSNDVHEDQAGDTSVFGPNETDELFLKCPPCFIVPPAMNPCHHGSVLSNLWCCHRSSHSDMCAVVAILIEACGLGRHERPFADLRKSNSTACWVAVFVYKLDSCVAFSFMWVLLPLPQGQSDPELGQADTKSLSIWKFSLGAISHDFKII